MVVRGRLLASRENTGTDCLQDGRQPDATVGWVFVYSTKNSHGSHYHCWLCTITRALRSVMLFAFSACWSLEDAHVDP